MELCSKKPETLPAKSQLLIRNYSSIRALPMLWLNSAVVRWIKRPGLTNRENAPTSGGMLPI